MRWWHRAALGATIRCRTKIVAAPRAYQLTRSTLQTRHADMLKSTSEEEHDAQKKARRHRKNDEQYSCILGESRQPDADNGPAYEHHGEPCTGQPVAPRWRRTPRGG